MLIGFFGSFGSFGSPRPSVYFGVRVVGRGVSKGDGRPHPRSGRHGDRKGDGPQEHGA